MDSAGLHLLLIETVTREHDCVLQFDGERQALRSWLWPQERSGALIAPENLREYRSSHDFLGPSCFCPALSSMTSPGFVEAAILQRGNSGFVAMCPTDSCGYLVFLSSIFERANMPTAIYPKRDIESIKPPQVYHLSEDKENVFGKVDFEGRKPSAGIDIALPVLAPARRVLPRAVRYRELLSKLDSKVQPGIPENMMKLLFVKCNKCGKVTTRRVFLHHNC